MWYLSKPYYFWAHRPLRSTNAPGAISDSIAPAWRTLSGQNH